MASRTLIYKVLRFHSSYRPLKVILLDAWIWILTRVYQIQKLACRFPVISKIAAISLKLIRYTVFPLLTGMMLSILVFRLFVR